MGNCRPSKTNVNLGFASVDIGFLGVTISNVILSCSQYLYNIHFQTWCATGKLHIQPYLLSPATTQIKNHMHVFKPFESLISLKLTWRARSIWKIQWQTFYKQRMKFIFHYLQTEIKISNQTLKKCMVILICDIIRLNF